VSDKKTFIEANTPLPALNKLRSQTSYYSKKLENTGFLSGEKSRLADNRKSRQQPLDRYNKTSPDAATAQR